MPDTQTDPLEHISLCRSCWCSTHTIDGKCGKCGAAKDTHKDALREKIEAILAAVDAPTGEVRVEYPNGKGYITNQLSLATDDILQLIREDRERPDRRTLETISSLLNGDNNQVDVVKGYVSNKLRMYEQQRKDKEDRL